MSSITIRDFLKYGGDNARLHTEAGNARCRLGRVLSCSMPPSIFAVTLEVLELRISLRLDEMRAVSSSRVTRGPGRACSLFSCAGCASLPAAGCICARSQPCGLSEAVFDAIRKSPEKDKSTAARPCALPHQLDSKWR